MAVNMRLKDSEQEEIEEASLAINKLFIEKGIQPVGTSGIAHMLLAAGIELAKKNPQAIAYIGNKEYRK